MCGVASLMDQLTGEPRYAPIILCDKTSGLVAAQSILAALYSREKTGRGQFIEIPMFETMVSFIMVEHLHGLSFDPPQGGAGYARVLAPWRRPYRDGGRLSLHAGLHRRAVAAVLGRGGPARDDAGSAIYRHGGAEPQHRRGLSAGWRTAAAAPTAEWIAAFDKLEIPAGPVKSLEEVIDDPHLAKVGFFKRVSHPTEGDLVLPDVPVRFAETPAAIDRLPPRLGEHGRRFCRRSA